MKTSIKVLLLTATSFLFVANALRAQTWTPASPNIYFTGGNVGIGTTIPGAKLEIIGRVLVSEYDRQFSIGAGKTDGTLGTGLTNDNGSLISGAMGIRDNWVNKDRLHINVIGNVGIGTTSPVTKLDVNGSINLASGYNLTWGGTYGANIPTIASVSGGSSYIALYPAGSTSGEKVRINNAGNVGIGTTGPNAKLEVSGSATPGIFVSSTNYPGAYRTQLGTQSGAQGILVLGNNGANEIRFGSTAAGGAGSIYVNNTADYTTAVAGTLAMYFKSDGNIGIGTTSPLAKLHVNNGSLLFDGTTGATPTSGAGTRMMWIPAKAAFRAGVVTGTQWNDASIGLNSVAFGTNTTASGSYSSAFGAGSIASGEYSSAFISSTASGDNSFSVGYNTTASGDISIAFGHTTTASGGTSSAFGSTTTASGIASAAFGLNTTAQSYGSLVVGRFNTISGTGGSWVDTDPLFVIGIGSSTSVRSNAVTVLKNGNVGIGTDLSSSTYDATYKLAVNGKIRAKEIVVETNWSDFVFEKNYKLSTLAEVEQYISANGHLPEIPTANEIETNGGNLGELVKLQMQKIEELTLYLIEQDKKIIEQNRRIEILEKN